MADEEEKKEKKELISEREIEEEMKSSYIDYAMSVIVGRAIPDVRDGLKPVHRRILFSMNELGLLHNKAYKKSARIVGDCMGKYHPHGDAAIYDSLVRMAQPFSLRYTLVDGHGNFGSIDGDSAAAMRYTEARMSRLAEEMLADIDKETVDFIDNFDGSLKEPVVLPSKFPSLLINGASGIAVGMATNIPTHNLKEVCEAVIALIDNPELPFEELVNILPGPDFPTGGEIIGRNGILKAMKTGRGSIIIRGKHNIEETEKYKRFVITEIPPYVNKATMVEGIAEAVKNKTIEGVKDIRDESNKQGIRVVLELKKGANVDILQNQLYKHSSYQTSFGINNVALLNNKPQTLNTKGMLKAFIRHREEVITRKTRYELNKAKEREHILQGLLIALENLDETIKIIRGSDDAEKAKSALTASFPLSEMQAEAILRMRLQRLTGLERGKLKQEHTEILEKIKEYERILSDKQNVLDIIKEEQKEIIEKYGDERKTEIKEGEENWDIEYEDLVKEEDIVVILTNKGYIKRMSIDEYKIQKRGGRGITATNTTDNDFVRQVFYTTTHSYLLIFTDRGKVYWLKGYRVPEAKRYSRGTPIINMIRLDKEERISAIRPVREIEKEGYLLMATKKGYVKKTRIANFSNPRKGGIIALTLSEGDNLINVVKTDGAFNVMLFTKKGYAIRFHEKKIRPTGRTSRGVIGIRLRKGDEAISLISCMPDEKIFTISEKGYGKRTAIERYRKTNRGGKGIINMKVNNKTGEVAYVTPVKETDELLIITRKGIAIRTLAKQISEIGRNTIGVRTIRLDKDDRVMACTRIDHEDSDEEEKEEKEEQEESAGEQNEP
jgi:DNA gyrase subunit A